MPFVCSSDPPLLSLSSFDGVTQSFSSRLCLCVRVDQLNPVTIGAVVLVLLLVAYMKSKARPAGLSRPFLCPSPVLPQPSSSHPLSSADAQQNLR